MSDENPIWIRRNHTAPNNALNVAKLLRRASWALMVITGLGVSSTWAEHASNHDADLMTDDRYLSSRIIKGGGPITQVCREYVGRPQIERSLRNGDQLIAFTLRAKCLIKPQDDGSDCPQYDITAHGTLDRTINKTSVALRDVSLRLICSAEGR